MTRIAQLVLAVPLTLAGLFLLKAALQPGDPAPRKRRVESPVASSRQRGSRASAPRRVPPGIRKLRPVPGDAPPAMVARQLAQPQADASPLRLAPPSHAKPVREPGLRPAEQAEAIADEPYYPITDAGDLPLMEGSWPGTPDIVIADRRASEPAAPAAAAMPTSNRAASPDLHAQRQRAAAMNERAYKLAQRGALFSARSELLSALEVIARAQDARHSESIHAAALAAALTALEESEDFLPASAAGKKGRSPADAIASHRTPVLKGIDASRLSPVTAAQHYVAHARKQLTMAAGGDEVASQSLYLLGKVHLLLGAESSPAGSAHHAQAIAFQQSALAVNPKHHQAANELGVLLARVGELSPARQVLLLSVKAHPTPAAWQNLAVVHQRLGEKELAERAKSESRLLAEKSPRSGEAVRWLDARSFAAAGPDVAAPATASRAPVAPGAANLRR